MGKLTNVKHEQFIQQVCKGNKPIDAYKQVFPQASNATARSNSHKLMKREDINGRFIDILNTIGLTDDQLGKELKSLVKADSDLHFKGVPTGHSIPDNRIRLDTLKLILQVKGQLKPDNYSQTNVNIFDSEIGSALIKRFDRLDRLFGSDDEVLEGEIVSSEEESASGG